ncbi:UDP-glucose dehydrogenase family protein [Bacillus sp. NTK034]|uniref:UDP-glucose dehydrogenase family protein n=1 Tax=Bacillus sp. NTK034 TaxID=2802176 RepID=UPI001A90C2AF|nr:UDP-glucose/GDP-mannose dehydrogenase family protein [Bacillus sp. NTK034]MBN8204246.1 UDP-glucose/GDP-mannose dehydrogenase family protein [Bacillus sp. NTK034]
MRIAVAGTGYVGLITGVCLAEMGHHVICTDIRKEKIQLLKTGQSPIFEPGLEPMLKNNLSNGRLAFTANPKIAYKDADIIFIAVGTPENHDGTANLDYIHAAAYAIGTCIENEVIICTKSTVPVGTNEKIKEIIQSVNPPPFKVEVVSNPEFLREGSAILDFFNGDRIILGTESSRAALKLEEIYLPLNIPIYKTDTRSAEMIKYASNAFLAAKISFINEIAAICEKVGANIEDVAYGIGQDKRIGPHFLQAGLGYGGSCFPKDTKALVQLAGNIQHQFELLESVIKVNNRQQTLAVRKAENVLGSLEGKRAALLGLAFKPDTDDVRGAASLIIAKKLLEEGAFVIAYDPAAIPNARSVLGNTIEYTMDIKIALEGADFAIIATEWDEIKHLSLKVYAERMKSPVIIDGRNCYSLSDVRKHPLTYISIGRSSILHDQMTRVKSS